MSPFVLFHGYLKLKVLKVKKTVCPLKLFVVKAAIHTLKCAMVNFCFSHSILFSIKKVPTSQSLKAI